MIREDPKKNKFVNSDFGSGVISPILFWKFPIDFCYKLPRMKKISSAASNLGTRRTEFVLLMNTLELLRHCCTLHKVSESQIKLSFLIESKGYLTLK